MSHETLHREEDLKPGSNRGFGLVMGGFFLLLTVLALWAGASAWALAWTLAAAGFAGLAWLAPGALAPLNALWFRLGLLLHKIVNPLVMGLMFFAVMTPIGLLMRLLGRRPLALGFDRAATSYWTTRRETQPGSMRKQY